MASNKQKINSIKSARGTEDVMPADWQIWRGIEKAAREVFECAGYYEIRTPVFEDTNLFVRSIGEVTDIVEKEMYTFNDGESTSITLRPENTASVMRAYVEYELHKTKKFQKFFYIGPQFRKERPQAGRLRQFHQMGIEAIGATDPLIDAETIIVAIQLYNKLGLNDVKVKINSIGCKECRPVYRTALKGKLDEKVGNLCDLCKARLNRNVLRVLDCKEEKCKEINKTMPSIQDHLCECCDEHFNKVKSALLLKGIDYIVEHHLVRGLDYYSKTVYEITHDSLGARDTICAGGRYDYLIEDIGGPATGAVGFAAGIEASILAIKNNIENKKININEFSFYESIGKEPGPDVYVVSVGKEFRNDCFVIVNELRNNGIAVDMDYEDRSTKAQMRTANKCGSLFTVMIGSDEIEKGVVKVKNMKDSSEEVVARDKLAGFLKAAAYLIMIKKE